MKITIDTKEDSHDEIRKIIRMLSSLVGEETRFNQGNIFEGSSSATPNSGNLLGNLFGGSDASPQTPPSPEEPKPKVEEESGTPSIEFYD